MKKIILSIVLLVVLIAGGVTVGVVQSNKAKTPTSTVEMDLNPGASFVVNSNNVVLSVSYTNEDADLIYSGIDVVGRNITEVAKDFTQKVIEYSSAEGEYKKYINIEASLSSGADENCITIKVSGNDEQAEALKNALISKVNAVFDENGIFGRAVGEIKTQTTDLVNKYADIAQDLKLDVEEFAGKTEAEILAIINEQGKKLEGLTSEALTDVETFVNDTVITNLKSAAEQLKAQIEKAKAEIEKIQADIVDALPEEMKQQFKKQIDEINKQIAELQKQLNAKLAEIEQKIDSKVAELKETAKAKFAELKTQLNAKIEAGKAKLEAHKAEFEQNKEAILESIKAWRDSFNA